MDLINAIDSNDKEYHIFLRNLLSVNNDLPSNEEEVSGFFHNLKLPHFSPAHGRAINYYFYSLSPSLTILLS